MKKKFSFVEKVKNIYFNISVDVKYYLIQRFLYKKAGHQYINKPLTEQQYSDLCNDVYGNKYLKSKYDDYELLMRDKNWHVFIIDKYLNPKKVNMTICDAGANKGYLMKAFLEYNSTNVGGGEKSLYDVYGFDILEDKSQIVSSKDDIVRKNFILGSILNIPTFNKPFDIVTCTNVFEHIPINKVDLMAQELLKLNPRYFVFSISKDVFSDGHITLKGSRFWISKFPGYRVMTELNKQLKKELCNDGEHLYCNTGVPRNHWNKCPGIIFLERME